jgi:ABC-type Na+ efflux pump permease subunit
MLKNIKQTIIDSFRLGYKDILDFTRDRMMLIAFIIMPLFMMVMMGYIFPSQSALKDIPLGIVNQDTGSIGNTVVESLSQMKLDEGQQSLFNITPV